jgi:hypothetical protein
MEEDAGHQLADTATICNSHYFLKIACSFGWSRCKIESHFNFCILQEITIKMLLDES